MENDCGHGLRIYGYMDLNGNMHMQRLRIEATLNVDLGFGILEV